MKTIYATAVLLLAIAGGQAYQIHSLRLQMTKYVHQQNRILEELDRDPNER